MATANLGFILSLPASADLSAKQYFAGTVDSSGLAAVAGAGVACAGIIQTKTSVVGDAVSIQTDRISKFVAGTGGVTAGDELEVEAGGALITQSAGVTVALALTDAAAGALGSCLLKG